MRRQLSLSIPKACSENFSNFRKTERGSFCSSCQKEVIDFSNLNDQEIIDYFQKHSVKTCGRLKPEQLKSYSINERNKSKTKKWGWGILPLSVLMFLRPEVGLAQKSNLVQNVTPETKRADLSKEPVSKVKVFGVIKEGDTPLAGAIIHLKGTNTGTMSGIDGSFSLEIPLVDREILLVSFIGFITQEIKISKKDVVQNNIELNVVLDEDDWAIMGEVEIMGLYQSKQTFFQKLKSIFN